MITKEEIECDIENCPIKLDRTDTVSLVEWIYQIVEREINLHDSEEYSRKKGICYYGR